MEQESLKPIRWGLLPIGPFSKLAQSLRQEADAYYDRWKKEHKYRPARERAYVGTIWYYVDDNGQSQPATAEALARITAGEVDPGTSR